MEEPVLNSHNKAEWEPAQVTAFPANGPEGRLQVQYLIEKESSVMLLCDVIDKSGMDDYDFEFFDSIPVK